VRFALNVTGTVAEQNGNSRIEADLDSRKTPEVARRHYFPPGGRTRPFDGPPAHVRAARAGGPGSDDFVAVRHYFPAGRGRDGDGTGLRTSATEGLDPPQPAAVGASNCGARRPGRGRGAVRAGGGAGASDRQRVALAVCGEEPKTSGPHHP